MNCVRWGIVGCGDVTEIKSGPGFQKAAGSSLVAVMRRDRAKAEDYARRHGVPRVHATAEDLIADPEVDAVYIATPPGSHESLALLAAAAGKPCLVEKPMARTHAECERMVAAFRQAGAPLWVAYYRRALPRFLRVRGLLAAETIGRLTSVHIQVTDRLATAAEATNWRFDPENAGAGLFLDLASHCLDLVDFLIGPIADVGGFAINTGGAYAAEDATSAAFAGGFRMRLAPLRAHGSWPGLDADVPKARRVDYDGPAAVLTLGRLRISQTVRFLRTSAKAEAATAHAPGMLWGTALARPPFVATCSLWESSDAIAGYAFDDAAAPHPAAITAGRAKPFHQQEAFIRFRPIASAGSLAGSNPLAAGIRL